MSSITYQLLFCKVNIFMSFTINVIKNGSRLECKKCNFYCYAEPFQEQKTEIFQNHLKSLPFLSITIEYNSMIDYLDRELLNQNNY